MRGGIYTFIHSKANNKYMKCYDSGKKINTLLILMQIMSQ